MLFTLTLDTSDYTMRKILNLCADLKDKGMLESYTPSPEPEDRSDIWDTYELIFILPPDTISSVENVKEYPTISKLIEIVSKNSGNVERIESWGKKRLAYEIGDMNEGDYVMFVLEGDRKTMKKVDKFCREAKEPEILRHMIIRKERA